MYKNTSIADFYDNLYQDICEEIEKLFQRRDEKLPGTISQILEDTKLTDHHAMRRFFRRLERLLNTSEICRSY